MFGTILMEKNKYGKVGVSYVRSYKFFAPHLNSDDVVDTLNRILPNKANKNDLNKHLNFMSFDKSNRSVWRPN